MWQVFVANPTSMIDFIILEQMSVLNLCEILIILHAYAGNLSLTHFPTYLVNGWSS
jgi:hypothetical protein